MTNEESRAINSVNGLQSALARFGAKVIDSHRDTCGDVDGGSLQEMAEQCGLLVTVMVTEPCGENCSCVENGDFPQYCLRYPVGLNALIAVLAKFPGEGSTV